MFIRIQLPHVYLPGSDPADKSAAIAVIHDLAKSLKLSRGYTRQGKCYYRDGTCAVFDLGAAFSSRSVALENSQTLTTLLDGMIRLNRAYLKRHAVPVLYRAGVTYRRTVDWLPIPALYQCHFGDCKSLGPALAAEYQEKGLPARMVHRWIPRTDGSGVRDYHVLLMVDNPDEPFECPSRVLGMGANENSSIDPS